jgi:hypothetical protein
VASIGRTPDDAIVISGAVLRALIDLAREWPGADDQLRAELVAWGHVGGVSLNLLDPELRRLAVLALSYACERAIAGDRSECSDGGAASGERLQLGAEAVQALLLGDFPDGDE